MDRVTWGDNELIGEEIKFEFENGVWQGPFVSRIIGDKAYAVKDLQALQALSSVDVNSQQFLDLAQDLIDQGRLEEVDIDLKQITNQS